MNKLLFLALSFVAINSAHAGMKYECWTYIGGKPDKMVYVVADNKNEAVELGIAKFLNLGSKFDYVQCK